MSSFCCLVIVPAAVVSTTVLTDDTARVLHAIAEQSVVYPRACGAWQRDIVGAARYDGGTWFRTSSVSLHQLLCRTIAYRSTRRLLALCPSQSPSVRRPISARDHPLSSQDSSPSADSRELFQSYGGSPSMPIAAPMALRHSRPTTATDAVRAAVSSLPSGSGRAAARAAHRAALSAASSPYSSGPNTPVSTTTSGMAGGLSGASTSPIDTSALLLNTALLKPVVGDALASPEREEVSDDGVFGMSFGFIVVVLLIQG